MSPALADAYKTSSPAATAAATGSLVSTPQGPAVLLSTLERRHPRAIDPAAGFDSSDDDEGGAPAQSGGSRKGSARAGAVEERSPIAQMLWTRWVVGLKEQRA